MPVLPALRPFTPSVRGTAPQAITLTIAPESPNSGKISPLRGESLKALTIPLVLTVQSSTPHSIEGRTTPSFTLTLALPDGRSVQAQSPTSLPVGATLTLTTLPPETETTAPLLLRAFPNTPAQIAANLTPLLNTAKSTPPPIPAVTIPTLALNAATPPPAVVLISPATVAIPGPLQLQAQTPLPPEWQDQTLTLTLRTSTEGALKPEIALPTTQASLAAPRPHPEIVVTLTSSLNLPLKQDIPVIHVNTITNTQNGTAIHTVILPQSQDVSPQPIPSSTLLSSLRLLLPPSMPNEPPLLGTLTARVLPPLVQTPTLQPIQFFNGTIAQIELPIPTPTPTTPAPLPTALPAGSVVVVNIPTLNGPAAVLQLHTNQPQLLPQAATTAPVATPQTPQAVLPIGSTVSGMIIGQNAEGQPLISIALSAPNTTPQGPQPQTFALTLQPQTPNTARPNTAPSSTPNLAATLVVGAKVELQIGVGGSATLLSVVLPEAAAKATAVANMGSQWAALAGALSALQNNAPNLAAQAKRNIPQLANLLPGLMRLLDALPEADTAKVLGQEAARVAQALGHNLTTDLAQLYTLTQRPEEGGWRGVLFPYQENPEGQPRQGGFFWRREEHDDPRGKSSARFVAELELTSLGAIQLDGLLTYPALWLKLRSHTPLGATEAQGMTHLVTTLLSQFGLEGGISLETTPTFPINPAQEIRARAEEALSLPT